MAALCYTHSQPNHWRVQDVNSRPDDKKHFGPNYFKMFMIIIMQVTNNRPQQVKEETSLTSLKGLSLSGRFLRCSGASF